MIVACIIPPIPNLHTRYRNTSTLPGLFELSDTKFRLIEVSVGDD